MKVKHLIEELGTLNPEASVELARVIAVTGSNEPYELRLDFPIIGLASNGQEVLLVIEHDKALAHFGKLIRMGQRPEG